MEMKQQTPLFQNLHASFIVLVIVVTLFEFGHGSIYRSNQAQKLLSMRHAKMYSQGLFAQHKSWREESMDEDAELLPEVDEGNAMADDDLIVDGLPGQPQTSAKFNQYAGYVNVDKKNGRSLFYYFAESAKASSTKPLILWLNGGPGCSSLGMGAFVEVGPFGVNPDGKTLYSRRFAWNKVANILFLESPAGVGFSYSNGTRADYDKSGDMRTAQDSLNFLINWFKRFPHYKSRDFYITGESYAGFYIPELADLIIKRNKMSNTTFEIQLKGIMIGNGIINQGTDDRGFYDFLWSHALISDETHQGILEQCLTSKIGDKCDYFQYSLINETGSVDFYNIYAPLCSNSTSKRLYRRNLGFDPCESDYVHAYLNLPVVQKAMHANTTKLNYTWELCSDKFTSWTDSPFSMFPIYERLFKVGLNILLYSGDVDSVVSVTGTRYSLNAMNLTLIKSWHPWEDGTQEVGGYKVVYEGLTFATVRGAGHQVPQYKPRSALALLEMFLANEHH